MWWLCHDLAYRYEEVSLCWRSPSSRLRPKWCGLLFFRGAMVWHEIRFSGVDQYVARLISIKRRTKKSKCTHWKHRASFLIKFPFLVNYNITSKPYDQKTTKRKVRSIHIQYRRSFVNVELGCSYDVFFSVTGNARVPESMSNGSFASFFWSGIPVSFHVIDVDWLCSCPAELYVTLSKRLIMSPGIH